MFRNIRRIPRNGHCRMFGVAHRCSEILLELRELGNICFQGNFPEANGILKIFREHFRGYIKYEEVQTKKKNEEIE